MKRFISACLAFLMLLPLSACDNGEHESEESRLEQTSEDVGLTDNTTVETDSEMPTETFEAETATTETETVEEGFSVNYLPAEGSKIVLANDDVYEWWNSFHWAKTDSNPYYRHADIYYPRSVVFQWETEEVYDYYKFYISADEDFADYESYLVNTGSLTLSHLNTGTTYYWRVYGSSANELNIPIIENANFTTAESPRCLKIDGVSNTRDIGGMEAADGYRIKQGMVYRGGKLDGITEEGKDYLLNYIGVKTDLDLRTPGEGGAGNGSPLGSDINYVNIDGRYYVDGAKGINVNNANEVMAQEIRLFADPDNYPIYIHCSLGRDRTGTLAMIIEALLGAGKNDIMMDYELSVFSVTGTVDNASVSGIRRNIRSAYDYIATFEGKSFSKKVENYVLSIGITAEEIQSIRDILLEEVK